MPKEPNFKRLRQQDLDGELRSEKEERNRQKDKVNNRIIVTRYLSMLFWICIWSPLFFIYLFLYL